MHPPETLPQEEIKPVVAPKIEEQPKPIEVDEGEPVTFVCRISGSPSKKISQLF